MAGPGIRHVVLTQSVSIGEILDSAADLIEKVEADGVFQKGGWRIVKRGTVAYQGGRVVYDCFAIKIASRNSPSTK